MQMKIIKQQMSVTQMPIIKQNLAFTIPEEEGGDVSADESASESTDDSGDEIRGAEEDVANHLPIPHDMRGPHTRRRPPREAWHVNPELLHRQQAATADEGPDQPRARRRTKPPDFLGIEKERYEIRSDVSQTLAVQLHDLQPPLTERSLTPNGPTPTGSCSPTPPATPLVTP